METPFEFETTGKPPIVYVRKVALTDLPADVQRQAQGAQSLYAVHDAEGARLALVGDRRLAFVLARQHDLTPVSAH